MSLEGKKVLVTAGPTYEPIDPVRFIGNRSTGKMGICIAEAAAAAGAQVILVKGPTHLSTSNGGIKTIDIRTAEEMYQACMQHANNADIIIKAAAVADYTPAEVATEKIKKGGDELVLNLKRTKDILKALGEQKKTGQILVGFALETQNELENAKDKLKRKNLDAIVLNSLKDAGAGFAHDTNKVRIIDKYNNIHTFELKSKAEVAHDIVDFVIRILNEK